MIYNTESLLSESIQGLRGTCTVVGDKSISHRAIMLSSIAEGKTKIKGILKSTDIHSTINAMRALGVQISNLDNDDIEVVGVGMHGLKEPSKPLNLGNAGTGVRLLMGLTGSQKITATFTGDDSLSNRPMGRITEPLSKMGIQVRNDGNGLLPITITGRSSPLPISYISPVASAQIKSAILLAGLNARGVTSITEPVKSRDHTERMLEHFGVSVDKKTDPSGRYQVSLTGGASLQAKDIIVPRDPSSAAFLVVAALITEDSNISLPRIGMSPERIGLITTLQEMGGNIKISNYRKVGGEEVADIQVSSSHLKGIVVPADRAPSMIDEYPILSVAAATASGVTLMENIGELRHKEADRIALMANGLRLAGVQVNETETSMEIQGTKSTNGKSYIKGGFSISSKHDHRIAMSFLTLGFVSSDGIIVDGVSTIETSFPGFVELMNKHGSRITPVKNKST